jgi:tetratricopeptide (TPR) repeat protein
MKSRPWRTFTAAAAAFVLGWIGWNLFQYSAARAAAAAGRQYLRERRDELAEQEFSRSLQWFPEDHELRLLWAQAVIGGRNRPAQEAAELALDGLRKIPDASPFAAESRMREGRLALLVLHQPDRAEQLLKKSLELDPKPADAWYLLWKLYELTERAQLAEPWFRGVWERTAAADKPTVLRDWYLSQFSPNAANAELDRRMGFLKPGQAGSGAAAVARLATFQRSEPNSMLTRTINAAYLIQLRDRESALPLLEELQSTPEARGSDFFLSIWVDLLLELGRLSDAQTWFEAYTGPRSGFLFDRTAGRMEQTVYRRDEQALECFERALSVWPGPAEWSLLHFRAQSLARLGKREEAEQSRIQARKIESKMELSVHQDLRTLLLHLNEPGVLRTMANFYRSLGCDWEAEEWSRLATELPSSR